MRSTQVSCPCCGSMLNFGEEIAAGSAVSCLICMQNFIAENVVVSDVMESPAPMPVPGAPAFANPAPAVVAATETAAPMVTEERAPASLAVLTMELPAPPIDTPVSPPPLPVLAEPATPPAPAFPVGAVAYGKPAAVVPPRLPLQAGSPAPPVRPADAAPMVLVGVVLGGMALLVVGGIAVIGVSILFGVNRTASKSDADPFAVIREQSAPPFANEPAVKNNGQTAIGGDGDVADAKAPMKPAGPATLAVPIVKNAGDPDPPPAIPVVLAGNVPGVDQERIDAAIAKGVAYLKARQAADGTWVGGPRIGYTALAGLTLLECKVPAEDAQVQQAAAYVRNNVATLNATYELSLAILFLDRLGNPKDRVVIQGMALRLLAGQNDAGGWTYHSPVLTPSDMHQLLVYLKSHRPELPRAIKPPAEPGKQIAVPDPLPKQTQEKSDDPFKQLSDLLQLPKAVQEPGTLPKQEGGGPGSDPKQPTIAKPLDVKPDKPGPASPRDKDKKPDKGAAADKDTAKKVPPINPNFLSPQLQRLPVVGLNANKGKVLVHKGRLEDNSNSQFALLGLWAARRHDVPTEYSLLLARQRYATTQNADSGWGYRVGHGSTNTMTNVGLIGLAMGHGAIPDPVNANAKQQDAAIQNGLRALGQYIGTPSQDPKARQPMQNLYFLWSVERVAMLCDLKTIGGKDWYGWGAQSLLPNQDADGHWQGGQYHGTGPHTDTCFALLFLKRSNLVPDLTENLRLYMVIRDPEAK